MRLTWMGTASLLLEADGRVLAFDPFPGISIENPVKPSSRPLPDVDRYRQAEAVFVTHGHFDHILYIPALYRDVSTPVYATATPLDTLRREGMPPDRLQCIAPGWAGDFGPFHIRAWQSRHCQFDGPVVLRTVFQRRLWTHLPHMLGLLRANRTHRENGEILFYELTDGRVRVQIMGSLNLCPDVEYPSGADYLILPFQGRSDIETYARTLAERLEPRQVLLDHYDDAFPPMTMEIPTESFCALVQSRLHIPCRALKKYETLSL